MKKATARQPDREALKQELRKELLEELRTQEASPLEDGGEGQDGGAGAGGFFSAKNFGAGALSAAAFLLAAENRQKLRPAVVKTMKELYRFRDWFGTGLTGLKEDLQDMSAEARKEYEAELARQLASVDRERELLQRLQDLSKQRGVEAK